MFYTLLHIIYYKEIGKKSNEKRIPGKQVVRMKRKLQDIIQEKFTYEDTHLLLPDLDLNFTAIESESFEGTFSFHSSNDHPIRGIVS